MTIFKDRTDKYGKLLTANGTLPQAAIAHLACARLAVSFFRLKKIGLPDASTMRANRTVRPTDSLHQFVGFFFVRVGVGECSKIEFNHDRFPCALIES